jgi:hypothetical protein
MSQNHGWPESNDPDLRELSRALSEARLRGPDDMTLRRGWTAVAGLVTRSAVAGSRGRRWSYFAGGIATTTALGLAVAALLWPRAVETPVATKAAAHVVAPEPGARRLTLDGGVEAKLSSASVMRLEGGAPRVEGGEVRFSVPRRPAGNPFVVRVARYRVVVLGTRFGVALDPARRVAVDVEDGTVDVYADGADGQLARLHRGQTWRSPASEGPDNAGAVAPPSAAAPSGALQKSEAKSEGKIEVKSEVKSGLRSDFASGGARGPRTAHRPLALLTPGGPAAATSPALDSAIADPTPTARAALAAGNVGKALQIYRGLAQRSGPAGENAAYQVGKILNEQLGQPANAVAAWRHYRTDHPTGILRLETDLSIIEVLARNGETDEALIEATDFLRRHPDSERRAEIARLVGDLYRSRGDCRRAVAAYQIAVGAARTGDVAETASFHRAECLVRLGDAEGPDAVRAYLRANPDGRFRSEGRALLDSDGHPH